MKLERQRDPISFVNLQLKSLLLLNSKKDPKVYFFFCSKMTPQEVKFFTLVTFPRRFDSSHNSPPQASGG